MVVWQKNRNKKEKNEKKMPNCGAFPIPV